MATEVFSIAKCQKNRSPANRNPIQRINPASRRGSSAATSLRELSILSQAQRKGIDRAMRQKALANGPTSANRTKMGEAPMATAPRTSATMGSNRLASASSGCPAEELWGLFDMREYVLWCVC